LWSDITNLKQGHTGAAGPEINGYVNGACGSYYLKKESVEFYKLLLEEVQERVERKIAANPWRIPV